MVLTGKQGPDMIKSNYLCGGRVSSKKTKNTRSRRATAAARMIGEDFYVETVGKHHAASGRIRTQIGADSLYSHFLCPGKGREAVRLRRKRVHRFSLQRLLRQYRPRERGNCPGGLRADDGAVPIYLSLFSLRADD
ncbi:hypothetical protein SDC9_66091 [bioreactor metagenome]|uniref:Uncharacterized protein n=1 Tax=bioreactor metagenome TaxID=1076179 RepID=A0A644XU34_9ZZZZ